MKHIAIFASGNGSNAENIIRHFNNNELGAKVSLVICNRREAKVIERAANLGVASIVITPVLLNNREYMEDVLARYGIDFIVLAGFLLFIPGFLSNRYAGRIINIHPSLLPAFGGKGMYGHRVHEAVVASAAKETGITVHHVNENYDQGKIIFQAKVKVDAADTPTMVEAKVHALESVHFPRVIEELISKL